jgi:hypothetical protein
VDDALNNALTNALGALHASVAGFADRNAMTNVTVLLVDGVEKARLG